MAEQTEAQQTVERASQVVAANGLSIYCERAGNGPRLLFISGTGGDLRNRPNMHDSPLARRFEVLAYDQRGLGQTDKPSGAYAMADYADDAAALLDALGWQAVPVVGVSFGGMVAQELALRHPTKVSALVLACTSSGGAGGSSYPLHELQDLPTAERAARQMQISDQRYDAAWQQAHPDAVARVVAMAEAAAEIKARTPNSAVGAQRQLEARRGHDTFSRLPEVHMPTLLVGGVHDGIAPAENMRRMASQIEGSELRFFDGGHMFFIQDKTAYPSIVDWLQETIHD